MEARNIASNLPNYFIEGRKPNGEDEKFQSQLIGKCIELVKGYAEALCEEIEAQLHYNEHKNEKKSNPSVWYDARDRLFSARWVTKELHDDPAAYTAWLAVQADLKQEAAPKFASPAEAFKHWLLKEIQVYSTALRHPERVSGLCSPDTDVYTKRYALLAQAFHTYSAGLAAAFKLWTEELEERYTGILGDMVSTFEKLEDGNRYSGGKTGYWRHDERAMRPILVTDSATIQRNKEWIDGEPARRERERQAYDEDVRGIIPANTQKP
jgi:hypothetical protein